MYNLKDKKLKLAALDDGDGGQALFECLNQADLHLDSRAFFLLNLWPKFGHVLNTANHIFFPNFCPEIPKSEDQENVVTPKILGGLKQGKLLYK